MENPKILPVSETPNVVYVQAVEAPRNNKRTCRPFLHGAIGFLLAVVLCIILMLILKWGPFHKKLDLDCYACGHIYGTKDYGAWSDFFDESCATKPAEKFLQACNKEIEACGKFELRSTEEEDGEMVEKSLLILKGCIPKIDLLDGTCRSVATEGILGNDTELMSTPIRQALAKAEGQVTSELCSCSKDLCNISSVLTVGRVFWLITFLSMFFQLT